MTRILSILSGSAGPYILIGVVLASLAAGGAGGWQARGLVEAPIQEGLRVKVILAERDTARCVATHQKARADGAEKVIDALTASAREVAASLTTLSEKAAARGKSLNQLLQEIANAPSSDLCGRSAPELAYRRSVQHEPAVPAAP